MAVTVSGTSITFNDGTTQTTAAVNIPDFLAVGSLAILYNYSNSSFVPGNNLISASTGYATSAPAISAFNSQVRNGNVTVPGAGQTGNGCNTAAVTGTWRALSFVRLRNYVNNCGVESTAGFPCLAIRIA